MPQSAWFAMKRMVQNLKRDFPQNFYEGPSPKGLTESNAILTWDSEGVIRIAYPCSGQCAFGIFSEGKLHRHTNGFWYIVTPSQNGGTGEVVSQ